jgi:hypothetical protein
MKMSCDEWKSEADARQQHQVQVHKGVQLVEHTTVVCYARDVGSTSWELKAASCAMHTAQHYQY